MPNVLIRDVAPDDLEQIKIAAAQRDMTLQAYVWETVHAQAAYLRRRNALAATARRLQGQSGVTDQARECVLEAIDAAHNERAGELSSHPSQ